jgi:hypothetical protein
MTQQQRLAALLQACTLQDGLQETLQEQTCMQQQALQLLQLQTQQQ